MAQRILRNPASCRRWRLVKALIIDEISMLDAPTFDLLEEVARILRQAGAVPGWLSSVRKRQLNSTWNND